MQCFNDQKYGSLPAQKVRSRRPEKKIDLYQSFSQEPVKIAAIVEEFNLLVKSDEVVCRSPLMLPPIN